MSVPDDRWYSPDHQWIQAEADDANGSAGAETAAIWRVGLTDFAQDALGEVSLVQLAESGVRVGAGDEVGEIEAFKAMTDVYMPVDATVVGFNARLADEPSLVNSDPYGDGWLCTVRVEDATAVTDLLDADAYRTLIGIG